MKFINKIDKAFYKLDRENIWIQQGRRCYYCKCILAKHEITADHVIPLKDTQGYHSSKNIVVACKKCNKDKGCKRDFVPDKWDIFLQETLDRIEERIKLAEYKLSFDRKGSFTKWKKYHEKQGRWVNITLEKE